MWFKKIRKKKMQSMIIILITLLCSALMTSSLVIMTSWQSPYDDLVKECNSEKLRIYLTPDTQENVTKLGDAFAAMEAVTEVESVGYYYAGGNVKLNGQAIEGFIGLSELRETAKKHMRLLEGRAELSEGECLISAVIANTYEAGLGGQITTDSGEAYTVVGIYTNPYNMSISYDNEIYIQSVENFNRLEYYINVYTDSAAVNDLLDDYRESNGGILEGRSFTLEGRISNNQITEQIFGAILLVFSILILLVSGIMIRYLIKNTLLTDRNSIAIYKTLGYANRHINGIYMTMYLVLVSMGSILGACISVFISDSFTQKTFMNLGTKNSSGTLWAGAVCVSAIVLYVLLQVYLVIRRTKNIKPIEVFRGVKHTRIHRKAKRSFPSFSPLAMAGRIIANEKKNTAIIIVTCVMAVYCVNFGTTALDMIHGMADDNYYWIGFDKHDVSAEVNETQDMKAVAERLRQEDGVTRAVLSTTSMYCSIPWERGIGDTSISAMVYDSYEGLEVPVVTGRNPKYQNEVAIGGYVADKLHKGICEGACAGICVGGQAV